MESGTNGTCYNKRVIRVTTTRRVLNRLGVTLTLASVCGTKTCSVSRLDKSMEKSETSFVSKVPARTV